MLGQIYCIAILLTVLLSSGVASIATYAKVHAIQLRSAQTSAVMQDARDQLLASIQTQIQNGTLPSQISAPSYTALNLCPGASTCPFTAAASFTKTGATGLANGGVAITSYNTNATLAEGRVSFTVTASVTQSGETIASRSDRFTYATFAQSPWAVDADSLDKTGAGATVGQGDRLGCDPANAAATCVGTGDTPTGTPGDTRAHVNAQCNGDPNECPWAYQSSYKPVDNFQNVTWTSTDANQ